jgi:uncharacterized beta-barrel protein YwiB (DUF1934 family)
LTLKNTDNEYIIAVVNKQMIDGHTEEISETACGSFYEKNDKQYILYKIESDGDRISVMIKIDNDAVIIKRSGSVQSSMEYRIGGKRSFLYRLPYGEIEMELETQQIISSLTPQGGKVKLVYTLSMQGEEYYNDTEITVKR